ncbi:sensor histidine kinase [Oricola cellulosilytica]|uniref:histidine kinase n=1 Tax=Oricola cellulosilytica TaxID=1429082 RepID=A0A4R0P892_9HYPH|nr:HAMP domain-containing sensor histidine kinase [Oricola cellulosilytica]TCD11830.1 HAMP domain-containing histidine kinase [Oricola cellulosilytica]
MSHLPSNAPDKTIVDRRKSYRNSDVRKAVRRTRDRLAEQGISDSDFDGELLAINARAVKASTIATLALTTMIATAALPVGIGATIFLWAAMMAFVYVAMSFAARKYLSISVRKRTPKRWANMFRGIHFALGLGWGWFAYTDCASCNEIDLLFFKAMALVIAMAATVTISHNLRGAVFAEFSVPVLVFAISQEALVSGRSAAAAAALLLAMLFFAFIAVRLQRASLSSLSFRNENNSLIAELEMARSISEEARRRAEDSNLAKSRFLASMSHELRTPLNAILGFSEVMANEVLGPIENESYRSYAHDINQSGTHLLKLINEILDLSRIEAGKQELQEEPLHLVRVIDDCIGLVQMKADQKRIGIEHVFEEEMPRLFADERSLRQVALNILSNAVKFTPAGGSILVKSGWTSSGGQYVSVRDNGPGISEEEIPIVLSAFGQGAIAIKNAEQGTGLGLPIVQALMAMHEGTFTLKSKLREGTEAIVIFPAARVMDELPAEPVRQPRMAKPVKSDSSVVAAS